MIVTMNGLIHLPRRGFTLVELLIVIVVIAILAAITLVAYNGVQQQAANSAMKADVVSIVKLIRLYHAEHGTVPQLSNGNYCLTIDEACTMYDMSTGYPPFTHNAGLMSQLSSYGSVPQSIAHMSSNLYGIYGTFTNNYTFKTSSGAATSTPTPVLIVFWLQGTNQDCTGISGLTSVTGNNPFWPGQYSNGSTGGGTLTRCYEVLTGFTS